MHVQRVKQIWVVGDGWRVADSEKPNVGDSIFDCKIMKLYQRKLSDSQITYVIINVIQLKNTNNDELWNRILLLKSSINHINCVASLWASVWEGCGAWQNWQRKVCCFSWSCPWEFPKDPQGIYVSQISHTHTGTHTPTHARTHPASIPVVDPDRQKK